MFHLVNCLFAIIHVILNVQDVLQHVRHKYRASINISAQLTRDILKHNMSTDVTFSFSFTGLYFEFGLGLSMENLERCW